MRNKPKFNKDKEVQKLQGGKRICARPCASRYPWDIWFAKKDFTLVKGKDFHGQPHGMMMTTRHAAKRHGLEVSVNVDGDRLNIRVL